MHLIKADNIIRAIAEKDESISFDTLLCWEKKEEMYSLYSFSIQLKSEVELEHLHEDLRDYIAIYFQSQMLDKEIERWNIYQFFFVEEKVNDTLKQKIEQDKFATRKILIDNMGKNLDDTEIQRFISEELYDFRIDNRKADDKTIDEYLVENNANVLGLLKKYEGQKTKEIFDIIINKLANE